MVAVKGRHKISSFIPPHLKALRLGFSFLPSNSLSLSSISTFLAIAHSSVVGMEWHIYHEITDNKPTA